MTQPITTPEPAQPLHPQVQAGRNSADRWLAAPLTARAGQLRDAVLAAVRAYALASQEYGEAYGGGVRADERVRLLDQVSDRYADVLRLTRELAALDSTGGVR